ncbi:serpin family protein [Actinoplanes sp. CA-142083]|uniref:serpin family protein n=1 Tax=Actinoplanes sp. CA-142083 TaxID=3239903 RepID=UPI003D929788
MALIAAGAMLVSGCGGGVPGDAGRIDAKLVSELKPGDAQAVAQGMNAFGFDLLREISDGKQNTITSPLSVSVLLAMILAGADGDTATKMAKVLHLDERRDVRVGALLRTLADTDEVKLSVADALWADEGAPLEQDYLDFVRKTFGATVEQADLGQAEAAKAIDEWAKKNTGGRIDQIASDLGLPDPQAMLVLLNAVYFLGEWTTKFEDTSPGAFAVGGAKVDVPMMHLRSETFGYAERDGFRMLRLPYGEDGRYAMEVMLPDEGKTLKLDAETWRDAVANLSEQEIDEVALPRFELRWSGDLTGPLVKMGLPTTGFTAMSKADPALAKVVHKTYIKVDEEGTEAAAVTGGVMATSARAGQTTFVVDRPFAFTISDQKTGAILFLGEVTDPRS